MSAADHADREGLWLPLLRELTATDAWAVWKNADSALYGTGDVDSAAPRRAWPAVEAVFRDWAVDVGLPAFACRHIPRTANYFALLDGELLQLEVKAGATFRGSVQFRAEDVLALSRIDPRGFRVLRPGAEGALKLVLNGMRRGGHPDWVGIEAKGVVELLRADPDGVAAMAERLGPGGAGLQRAVEAVLVGEWDRRAMLRVEAWALARALVQPHVVAERAWFRVVRKPSCPVLQVVYRGRTVPTEAAGGWLARVGASHPVWGAS